MNEVNRRFESSPETGWEAIAAGNGAIVLNYADGQKFSLFSTSSRRPLPV